MHVRIWEERYYISPEDLRAALLCRRTGPLKKKGPSRQPSKVSGSVFSILRPGRCHRGGHAASTCCPATGSLPSRLARRYPVSFLRCPVTRRRMNWYRRTKEMCPHDQPARYGWSRTGPANCFKSTGTGSGFIPARFQQTVSPLILSQPIPPARPRFIRIRKLSHQPSTTETVERKCSNDLVTIPQTYRRSSRETRSQYRIWIYSVTYGFRCFKIRMNSIREIPKLSFRPVAIHKTGGAPVIALNVFTAAKRAGHGSCSSPGVTSPSSLPTVSCRSTFRSTFPGCGVITKCSA